MRTYGKVTFLGGGDGPRLELPKFSIDCEPHVRERLKRIFPQIETSVTTGQVVLSATPETGKDVLWALSRWPMELSASDEGALKRLADEYDKSQRTVENILAGGSLVTNGMQPVIEPYPFQVVGSDIILSQGRMLLMDEVGLGKSFTSLLTMRDWEALPMLIVTETHTQRQWQRQISKFFPMATSHIIRKGSVYNIARTREMHGHSPQILIITYAKLDGWAPHLKGLMRTIVFDESQALRHNDTKRYAAARMLSEAALFVVGPSATPVFNYGGEMHTVLDVIKPGCLGTRKEFQRAWGHETSQGHIILSDPKAFSYYLRDQLLVLRRTRKEVGKELPETIVIPHEIEVDQKTLTRELELHGTDGLANLIVSGSANMSSAERRHVRGQFDWQLRRATGVAKAPYVAAFTDLLLAKEAKVVVAVHHRDVYDILREALAHHNPVLYSGSESVAQKDRNAMRFVQDESCRVLLMALRSGAGLDGLQEGCNIVVFGELDWSPKLHDQLIGRLRRDGMNDPVVAYYLTTEYGSDPFVLEANGLKRGQSQPIEDPELELFQGMATDLSARDRLRDMAREHLKQRKSKLYVP